MKLYADISSCSYMHFYFERKSEDIYKLEKVKRMNNYVN